MGYGASGGKHHPPRLASARAALRSPGAVLIWNTVCLCTNNSPPPSVMAPARQLKRSPAGTTAPEGLWPPNPKTLARRVALPGYQMRASTAHRLSRFKRYSPSSGCVFSAHFPTAYAGGDFNRCYPVICFPVMLARRFLSVYHLLNSAKCLRSFPPGNALPVTFSRQHPQAAARPAVCALPTVTHLCRLYCRIPPAGCTKNTPPRHNAAGRFYGAIRLRAQTNRPDTNPAPKKPSAIITKPNSVKTSARKNGLVRRPVERRVFRLILSI